MNPPVLIVNGQAVTRFELGNAMEEYALQMYEKSVDELDAEEQEEILQTSVERLLTWELIYQHALADGVAFDEAVLEQELVEITEQFESPEEMLAELAESGADAELLRRSVRRELLVAQVLDTWFDAVPEASDEEVETAYAEYLAGHAADADESGDPLPREQIEPMIRDHLRQIEGTEKIRDWVDDLREAAEIETFVEF
jgi:hypothetical protein